MVTILANSAFQSNDQYIQSDGWYALVHTRMNRALLWKAEFARILTSCTWWYIQVCTGLCWFLAVPYYSMVCTAMELCCHYHNWVHTNSCHVLKIKVKSLNSMYWDKPGTYQYVLRHTVTNPWTVCTEINLVHTGMYWDKPGMYSYTLYVREK